MVFESSSWVWLPTDAPDTYGDFAIDFTFNGQNTVLRISCDGYLCLRLNGAFVPCTQYPDYPHYKAYETVDLTPYCAAGDNTLVATVWHIGMDGLSTYAPATAGVIYELEQDGAIVKTSAAGVPCRPTAGYRTGMCKLITPQLGPSFEYDATAAAVPYTGAVAVDKPVTLVPRPVKPLVLSAPIAATCIGQGDGSCRFDLGAQTVGYITLSVRTDVPQRVMVTWSEHLTDGHAARYVGTRDFSFFYTAAAGHNVYENRLLRFACRYIEVHLETDADVTVSVTPVDYPVTPVPFTADTPLLQRIYDTCVRTLRCCMHDHYEDGPWREQALYSLDSRNQMLCGYYAFREYDYAEKNLLLMAKGRDRYGFLPLCAPAGFEKPIPSFSLVYLFSVDEFETHAGRLADAEIFDTAEGIIRVFAARLAQSESGLIPELEEPFWNFYEWTDHCDELAAGSHSLLLNALFLLACERYRALCARRGVVPCIGDDVTDAMRSRMKAQFLREDGTFRISDAVDYTNCLANSLAILCGLCGDVHAKTLADTMIRGELPAASLSMNSFYYDALYRADRANRAAILDDIQTHYGYMLEQGATSFWETILGAADFDGAGSLCHGWSALPLYYLHKFKSE